MTTFSGLVDQPRRGDVRVRPIVGDTVQFRDDDPILPRSLVDRLALRPGVRVEVEIGQRLASAAS